uniref:Putative electron transport protein SCO1/SenC n=1 Tax=uncultured prokaryote AT3 TaxID=672202 RepID=D3W8F1_9ZZZZ|nr:putative electron transport protein SCO1/SenC [uncultured prokaryote AT3]
MKSTLFHLLVVALLATTTPSQSLAADATPGAAPAQHSVYDWPFEITDLTGQKLTLATWRGKTAVIAMDHTGSIVVCSQTSRRLRAIQNSAQRLGKPFDFIVISLDPEKDTAEGWQRYLRALDLPDAKWHFLRPSKEDALEIARRLGVNHWTEGEYLIHDLKIVRVDRQGRIVRTMEGYDRYNERFLR